MRQDMLILKFCCFVIRNFHRITDAVMKDRQQKHHGTNEYTLVSTADKAVVFSSGASPTARIPLLGNKPEALIEPHPTDLYQISCVLRF